MKKSWLLHLVFLGIMGLAIEHATAGSAVVADGHGNLATAYGGPVAREKERALNTAHQRYGSKNFQVLAATDVSGYGAIAVANHPNGHGSLVGIALGKRSQTEAVTMAIDHCIRAGGTHPQVRWSFRG